MPGIGFSLSAIIERLLGNAFSAGPIPDCNDMHAIF